MSGLRRDLYVINSQLSVHLEGFDYQPPDDGEIRNELVEQARHEPDEVKVFLMLAMANLYDRLDRLEP